VALAPHLRSTEEQLAVSGMGVYCLVGPCGVGWVHKIVIERDLPEYEQETDTSPL